MCGGLPRNVLVLLCLCSTRQWEQTLQPLRRKLTDSWPMRRHQVQQRCPTLLYLNARG